jgi:hypothetical protein
LDLDLSELEAQAQNDSAESAAIVWGQGEVSYPEEVASELQELASLSATQSSIMTLESLSDLPSHQNDLTEGDKPAAQVGAMPEWAQHASRKAAPMGRRGSLPHWMGGLVCGLLACGLLAQYIIFERDRLAALFPWSKPGLTALCIPLSCVVQPVRQLDALVIDSSAFNRVKSGAYRLSFTVNNTARYPVAAPALELTLTDAQDKPLVRRVFSAAEAGWTADVIQARSEWSDTLHLWLDAEAIDADKSAHVAGYHLLVFYPR